jgi:hypothetical protein
MSRLSVGLAWQPAWSHGIWLEPTVRRTHHQVIRANDVESFRERNLHRQFHVRKRIPEIPVRCPTVFHQPVIRGSKQCAQILQNIVAFLLGATGVEMEPQRLADRFRNLIRRYRLHELIFQRSDGAEASHIEKLVFSFYTPVLSGGRIKIRQVDDLLCNFRASAPPSTPLGGRLASIGAASAAPFHLTGQLTRATGVALLFCRLGFGGSFILGTNAEETDHVQALRTEAL